MVRALALLVAFAQVAHAEPTTPAPRWTLRAEVFTRAEYVQRRGQDLRQFRLDRAQLGADVAIGAASDPQAFTLAIELESLRSAGPQSTVGLDGDSLFVRPRRAELAARVLRRAGVVGHVRGGLVDDPWIAWLDQSTPLRALGATASEGELGWPASDVGVTAHVRHPRVAVSAAALTGEGRRYPERNDGVNLSAQVEVAAWPDPSREAPPRVAVAATYRDGSIGPAALRDHRAGLAATLRLPAVKAGVEAVHAWGYSGDAALRAWSGAAWADVTLAGVWHLATRGAGVQVAGESARRVSGLVAAGWSPHVDPRAVVRLDVALEVVRARGLVLPGTDAVDATRAFVSLTATTR